MTNEDIETKYSDWNDTPVLFLMENPSLNYEIYCEDSNGKWPTNTWYWIHRRLNRPEEIVVDDYLVQGKYGEMVYSLICNNKLSNAYLTNVIKCGLNGKKRDKESYLGTWWYSNDCKKNCVETVLSKEVKSLTNNYDRLIVFAFGSNAYWLAKDFLQFTDDEYIQSLNKQLVLLPHPSSRLNNRFRRILLSDYVEKVITHKEIDKIESNNNLLKTAEDLKQLKKNIKKSTQYSFNESNRNFDSDNPKQVLKIKTDESLFSKGKQIMKEIVFYTTEKKQYGYYFFDKYFWAWDENKKDFIEESEYETDEYFISFKKALEGNDLL